jgi:hypothetical protein
MTWSSPQHDQLRWKLTVSVLTGTPAGGTYKPFNAPVINSFSSITLPPLARARFGSTIWRERNHLGGELALSVVEFREVCNSITPALNGLVKLQAQTNSLAVGISTNWGDYPGGAFNGVVHATSPDNPCVFFRLATQ